MPLFEYQCPEGHVSEHYQSSYMSEAPSECPTCERATPMKRVVSAPAPPVMGGVEGKLRTAAMVKKRNDAHAVSKRGVEEHRANVAKAHKRLGI